MLRFQPFKGPPVHPLGLAAVGVRNASRPAKPFTDVIGPPHGSIVYGFPLAGIRQPVAMSTGSAFTRMAISHPPLAASPELRGACQYTTPTPRKLTALGRGEVNEFMKIFPNKSVVIAKLCDGFFPCFGGQGKPPWIDAREILWR